MIEINPANSKTWSVLGPRGTFGTVLLELAKENEKIMAVTADLSTTAGLHRFGKIFPGRLINTGIAEQNMIGVAAAFASEGFIPFAVSFANFSVLRAFEAVRHFMGNMQRNVKLVGMGSGFSMSVFGDTHHGKEDMAALRALTGITILSPADTAELVKAIEASILYKGPVYIRLTGSANHPAVYTEDFDFEIGKAIRLKKGTDVTVIATGSMVWNAMKAAGMLEDKGISASVIDMHTLRPLDAKIIDEEIVSSKLLVTVEEHSRTAGLGGAVAEQLGSLKVHPPLLQLGIGEVSRLNGDYHFMLGQHGLLPGQIADAVEEKYSSL
jgi:transketolase